MSDIKRFLRGSNSLRANWKLALVLSIVPIIVIFLYLPIPFSPAVTPVSDPHIVTSYLVFKNSTGTFAKNGITGKIDYSNTGTNSRTVIQQALNATGINGGGKVFFSSGTYTVDSFSGNCGWTGLWVSLCIPSNVSVEGEGRDSTIIKPTTGNQPNRFVININPTQNNISLRHITLDYNSAPLVNSSGAGLSLHGNDFTVDDVKVVNTKREAIEVGDSNRVQITNCVIDNVWTGITGQGSQQDKIFIQGCRITNTAGDAVLFIHTSNLRAIGNHIENIADTGFDSGGNSTSSSNWLIADNVVKQNSGKMGLAAGTRFTNINNVNSENNQFYNLNLGIGADTGQGSISNIVINGNLLYNNTNGISYAATSNTIVTDNSLYLPSPITSSIGIIFGGQSTIASNNIDGYGIGIQIYPSSVTSATINNNLITNYHKYAIDGNLKQLTRVTIAYNHGVGQSGALFSLIENNTASTENRFVGNVFENIGPTPKLDATHFKVISSNRGFISEANGTATITPPSKTVTVYFDSTHNPIGWTPAASNIGIVPAGNLSPASYYWIGNITSSKFDIATNAAPSSSVQFGWNLEFRK